jgi:hypothetical protein
MKEVEENEMMDNEIVILVAEVAHEANRAYCLCMGDISQVPWAEAPAWQRESEIAGVRFHMRNPDASPEDSHKSWLKEKADAGWCYGPMKDVDKKEHPCFVPYEHLPVEQRAKDYIFSAVVKTMLKRLGRDRACL